MSDCVSNLKEIIEPPNVLYATLKERARLIPKYVHLGPPDLCYLVKEQRGGIFGNTSYLGYYHYVYGVDCSSSASIAVYINSLIKAQEKDGWMKKQKFKIVKAIFCIYDPMTRLDVRVEVNIPGGTNAYSMTHENVKAPITGIEWNFVFVSSILRAFNPQYSNCLRIVNELETKQDFSDFLLVVGSLHKAGYSNSFVETDVTNSSVCSYLLNEVCTYLREKKRINELIEFMEPYTKEDPALMAPVVDALFEIGKLKESIIALAENLTEYPMLAPLLIKQADAFIKYEYYEYALKIAKI